MEWEVHLADRKGGRVDIAPPHPTTRYAVRSVDRVLNLLDALQDTPGGASLGELAEATGLPKSSAFRYLQTLKTRGYVERDPVTGNYGLGVRFFPLQVRALDVLAARARPHLEQLRDRFEETLNLAVLDRNRVYYLEIVESPRTMRFAARPGDRDPIHSTALGKAIASQLSDAEVRRILQEEGMPQLTLRTITNAERFMEVLEDIRRRGFAIDDGENEQEGRCIGVPVPIGAVRAGLSLSAPAARLPLTEIDRIAAPLMEAARRLARELEANDV